MPAPFCKAYTCREEQDLKGGAVKIAQLARGGGKQHPGAGDLVYFQWSIRDAEGKRTFASTERADGGSGCPHAAILGKGVRIPRGWEIAMAGACHCLKQVGQTVSDCQCH